MWAVGSRKVMAWVKIKVGAICGQRIGVEQMKREQERWIKSKQDKEIIKLKLES